MQDDINPEHFATANQREMDKRLAVKFYTHPQKDKAASLREGRPIFKDREYIDIRIPGSREVRRRPASARDKARFSEHYQAFKNRTEKPMEGTPLVEWPLIERSACEELAFYNIKTVEQLAHMSDGLTGSAKGLVMFKRKAQDWLERANGDVTAAKLKTELEERDRQIADLQAQMQQLMQASKPKPKPRRVKNADPDDKC